MKAPNRIPKKDLIYTSYERCKCGGGLCHPVAPPENFPEAARGAWLCEHFFTEAKLPLPRYYALNARAHSLYPFGFDRKDSPYLSLNWELGSGPNCSNRQTTRPGGYKPKIVARLYVMLRGVEIVKEMRDAMWARKLRTGKRGDVVMVSDENAAAFHAAVDAGLDVGKLRVLVDHDLLNEHFIARELPAPANDPCSNLVKMG